MIRVLRNGTLYELFDRDNNEYYYFIDNKGNYVGVRKINYMNGLISKKIHWKK